MLIPNLIRREFRGSQTLTGLFIANLTIGLLGFIVLDGFNRDFQKLLTNSARAMLTADIAVSSRRALTEDEVSTMQKSLPVDTIWLQQTGLYSMAAVRENSQLVEIRAIEEGYPFYGHVELEQFGKVSSSYPKDFFQSQSIWVADSLKDQLDLKIGDTLKLGALDYLVSDFIIDESAVNNLNTNLAPRVIINRKTLAATNLVQKGTVAWHSYLAKTSGIDIPEAAKALKLALLDPGIRVKTYLTAGQDNGRMLQYLNDYLGIVSLCALALAGLGASYLFQSYLNSRRREIGILLSLGMTHGRVLVLYTAKLMIWGLLAALIACILGSVILPLSGNLVSQLSPLAFEPQLGVSSVVVALAVGCFYALFICLPVLVQILGLRPGELFQETLNQNTSRRLGVWSILALLPAALAFYFLAVALSHSWKVGSLFFVLIIALSALLALIGKSALRLLSNLKPRQLSWRLCFRYLNRRPWQALASFVSISIGTLLVCLIPELRTLLLKELESPQGITLPSLFLFDIQEEQVGNLQKIVENNNNSIQLSPMIRARLLSINDLPFERQIETGETREEEMEGRMRNRGINLSYRQNLDSSERISKGRQFSPDVPKDGVAEITIEERYADRLGIDLGDIITFSVQDIPIKGRIVGLRKVRWNSFAPNFFIQFQPGVLDDAPKTFVASIGPLSDTMKLQLQRDIVAEFANISIIDVSKLIVKIVALIQNMSMILLIMALLTVLAGFIVLFSIANHQARIRQADINLLKVLGMKNSAISHSIQNEFLVISSGAALFGLGASLAGVFIINNFIFETSFELDITVPVSLAIAVIVLCVVISKIASHRILRRKPSFFLEARP